MGSTTSTQITLEFNRRPIATQSVRFTKSGHRYQPKHVVKFKKALGNEAKKQLPKGWQPLDCEIHVELNLCFALPKGSLKALRDAVHEEGQQIPMLKRPDIDNCTKGILDSFNDIVWVDDHLIRDIHIRKSYCAKNKITLTVKWLQLDTKQFKREEE